MRVDSYCEIQFLENFFREMPVGSFIDTVLQNADLTMFVSFCDILFSKMNLCIDVTLEELVSLSQNNPLFQKLIDSHNSGGSRIIDFSRQFELLKDEESVLQLNPTSTHLYHNPTDYYATRYLLGFLSTNPSWHNLVDVLKLNLEFKLTKNRECPGELQSWKILQKFSNWTNAAIIADPYLVNNPKRFEHNLYQLIHSLLPPTLDRPFHLSFLTRISNLSKGKEIFQSVEEYLKGLDKNYPIYLGIYLNATIHDRTIMTNYYRVHSGHSFEYFNQAGKVTKDTTLIISGILGTDSVAHFELKNALKNAIANSKSGFDHFGYRKNRLLDD